MSEDHIDISGLVLETSAACQLKCPHCALRTFSERPSPRTMPPAVVEAVVPHLAGLGSIDLTGWGEPLLNPEFFAILALIRRHFSGRLTMTTNGVLLDGERIERILDHDFDTVCVSVDASEEAAYRRVRPGGDFGRLLDALSDLARRRDRRGKRPLLFATFLLRRSALGELGAFVRLASGLGLDGVVLQHLTGVYSEADLAEAVHGNYYGNEADEAALAAALAEAREAAPAGFMIAGPERIEGERTGGCGGFDLGRPFVTAGGLVSACCAMAYPWVHLGRDRQPAGGRGVTFGDARVRDLLDIRHDPAYGRALAEIRSGIIPAACGDCIGLYMRPGEVWTK